MSIEKLSDRPLCPECGSRVNSHGLNWQCVDVNCGLNFSKHKRGYKQVKPGTYPPCPNCGSNLTFKSATDRLRCKDCKRTFSYFISNLRSYFIPEEVVNG